MSDHLPARLDVACVGVHVLDVLARPIDIIPEGQGGARIDEIRITAAGTAGGTAVDLARLGIRVASFGCLGDDAAGRMLRQLLDENGVDASALTTTDAAQTSASVLPIRPNGDRPAFHVVGANGAVAVEDLPLAAITAARHVHLGGPDSMPRLASEAHAVLDAARAAGASTSLDVLSARPSRSAMAPASLLPWVDWFLPNEEQLCELAGVDDVVEAAHWALRSGAGGVVVSLGADGCLVVTDQGAEHLPAREVEVVDTTGCGDALSAGFLARWLVGDDPVTAARFGVVASGLVATGLGSDAGIVDAASVHAAADRLAFRAPQRTWDRRDAVGDQS